MPSHSLAVPGGTSARPRPAFPGRRKEFLDSELNRSSTCALHRAPFPSLAAPAGTSARPRLACHGGRRGALGYDNNLLTYRLSLSSSKVYMSILLHVEEVG